MLTESAVLNKREEFIFSLPQFQLQSPGKSPFEALPATTITNSMGSFEIRWDDSRSESGTGSVYGFLEDIVQRSRLDAEKFTSSAPAHINYGLALMNCGRLPEAAAEFLTALDLSPNQFFALASLARIRTQQGRFAEAEVIYKQLIAAYPDELSPLVNLSYILLRTGRVENAATILNSAIRIDSEAIFPRYLMAVALLNVGKPHEAIAHLRVAARNEVRSPAIHQSLGVAYLMAGDARGAVRAFKTALTLAPDMKDAVHGLANVLLERGHSDALVELLTAYLDRRPNDNVAREILSEAYSRLKQYPAARLQLTTVLRSIDGDDEESAAERSRLLNNIGVCFDGQGERERAIQWIERAIAVKPEFGEILYLNLIRLYMQKRQTIQATRILARCKQLFPESHEATELEAVVLNADGKFEESTELLRKEISTGKATDGSYAILGSNLTDIWHDYDDAQEVLRGGLQRYPDSALLLNNLAYALFMDGRAEEGREILRRVHLDEKKLTLVERVVLTATTGLAYLWEGDLARGKYMYEQASEIAHESPDDQFPTIVRQKMHLELAKALLRDHDTEGAQAELSRGIAIQNANEVYAGEIRALLERIGGRD